MFIVQGEKTINCDPLTVWAEDEVHAWTRYCKSSSSHHVNDIKDYLFHLEVLNERYRDVFIIDFVDGHATARAKDPRSHDIEGNSLEAIRLALYLDFFNILASMDPSLENLSIAVCVGDLSPRAETIPIFGFQKTTSCSILLIPDIDFLNFSFYETGHDDEIGFGSKLDQVIFCGSSTGKMLNEADVISNNSERLMLASFYEANDDILIKIGAAVQCTSDRAAQILREKPYFSYIDWKDQLRRKYIFSIDGNGATCSRVALALRSNSMLLKYKSEHQLFYFRALQPEKHYILIEDLADLQFKFDNIMNGKYDTPAIAQQSCEFYKRYLVKDRVIEYTLILLSIFSSKYFNQLNR